MTAKSPLPVTTRILSLVTSTIVPGLVVSAGALASRWTAEAFQMIQRLSLAKV